MKSFDKPMPSGTNKVPTLIAPGVLKLEKKIKSYTKKEAETLVLLAKVFHIFFPDNSPEVYGAKSDNGLDWYFLVQSISHDKAHSFIMKEKKWESDQDREITLGKKIERVTAGLVSQMKEVGFPYDFGYQDFIFDERTGKYIYVDFVSLFDDSGERPVIEWDEVISKIQSKVSILSEADKLKATNYLGELRMIIES
jgi:hypothetical protein